MRRYGVGITVRTFMATVAIVAVALAMARAGSVHGAAIVIVTGCISILAYIRHTEVISLRRMSGLTTTPPQKAGMLLVSITVAAVIIGSSDLAFLIGYHGYLRVADATILMSHMTPSIIPSYMAMGWIVGAVLALCVASCLRKTVWMHDRPESWHPLRWLKFWWPVGLSMVIGVLLVADHAWKQYSFCLMMAEYHAKAAVEENGLKEAASHAWLKQWYKRASVRPWLPVHPDRLPPE